MLGSLFRFRVDGRVDGEPLLRFQLTGVFFEIPRGKNVLPGSNQLYKGPKVRKTCTVNRVVVLLYLAGGAAILLAFFTL